MNQRFQLIAYINPLLVICALCLNVGEGQRKLIFYHRGLIEHVSKEGVDESRVSFPGVSAAADRA